MKSILAFLFISIFVLNGAACDCGEASFDPASLKPETLRDLIAEQQKKYIRPSFNEYDCFTEVDYQRFVADRQPAKIAAELQRCSKRFQAVVALITELPKDEQPKLLNSCRKPLRPTWREMGRISSTGDGNTEAGNLAERNVADAIADLVEQILANQ
jgi:hypothetical protein